MNEEGNKITTTTKELISLDINSEVNGRFILGGGRINEKQCYCAYEMLEDEGKKLFKMDAAVTVIYDKLDENDMAYAEIDTNGWGETVSVRLYVPKGTIVQEYDLSLEY